MRMLKSYNRVSNTFINKKMEKIINHNYLVTFGNQLIEIRILRITKTSIKYRYEDSKQEEWILFESFDNKFYMIEDVTPDINLTVNI